MYAYTGASDGSVSAFRYLFQSPQRADFAAVV